MKKRILIPGIMAPNCSLKLLAAPPMEFRQQRIVYRETYA